MKIEQATRENEMEKKKKQKLTREREIEPKNKRVS